MVDRERLALRGPREIAPMSVRAGRRLWERMELPPFEAEAVNDLEPSRIGGQP